MRRTDLPLVPLLIKEGRRGGQSVPLLTKEGKHKMFSFSPFSPKGEGQGVRLIVYDVLGNEVATLVNEELPAGEYEVEFSAKSGSASGGKIY